MTREEKEQTGKYVLQMARLLEDGCYQQEMLLKAVHIIDEALEQEPTTKNDLGVDAVSRKDVHDMLENLPITVENKWFNWLQKACMRLAELPPVTPQESRWIPVSERLPEEHEWIGTKTFGTTISDEVYVTFENPKGERFTEHLSFQNGKVSNFVQREIDALHKGSVPIAWMPLPKPYKPQESEDKE